MTGLQEAELFARLGSDSRFEAWLAESKADAIKYLAGSVDAVALHRAQGKYLFIEEMEKLLAKGKTLR